MDRRVFIQAAAAAAAAGQTPDELSTLDATALADMVRKGKASPLELVDAAIRRIEKLNPTLNAVIWERFEKAREEAKSKALPHGPFSGVPFLTKDLGCAVAGEPESQGSRFLKNNAYKSAVTTELARRIQKAGFINLGRTNTPEFGSVASTEPLAWGPTKNPWDVTRTTSGSSGGSATAVASLMVPVAHGSDGGGSLRTPAAACGVIGLKPSRGRVSVWPGTEWVSPVSVQGFETRSVRDQAACLDFASGALPGDTAAPPALARPLVSEVGASPGRLRIGLMTRFASTVEGTLDPECRKAVEETGKLLESLGHHVEVAHPAVLDEPKSGTIFIRIWPVRLLAALQGFERRIGKTAGADDLDPDTRFYLDRGRQVPASDYLTAMEDMQAFTVTMAAWWANGFDLLITPTLGMVPPKIGTLSIAAGHVENVVKWTPFTSYFNMTGQPAVSLPLHWTEEGIPVGVQFVAAYAREDVLIRVASQVEAARPWGKRIPPVHG
ncbi:MAG TPA: amidase [Bryobacteraceae bacterium]|nr:amidase [Bryobacteraceae bacterium]